MFCALAFLKTAQKFDSYLASFGLPVAQTGSGMGMEVLMGLRCSPALPAAGAGARAACSKAARLPVLPERQALRVQAALWPDWLPNSKAAAMSVTQSWMAAHAWAPEVASDLWAGHSAVWRPETAPRSPGNSVSSVALRPAAVSGSTAGEVTDCSIKNYMPHLSGTTASTGSGAVSMGMTPAGVTYSAMRITGDHISTTVAVDLYRATQYDRPSAPHSMVSASDGSQWYQIASGEGMGAFYQTPQFTGDASESA